MRSDELDMRRRRAVYRASHRGTKEMDWLLGRYAAAVLPTLESDALAEFERFLSLPDPDLHQWIVSPDLAKDSDFAALIASVRRFHGLA